MKSHFDPSADLKWDQIALAMSIEVDNAVTDYVDEQGATDDPEVRAALSIDEIRDHVMGQIFGEIFEQLSEDDVQALAIAWLHGCATEAAKNACGDL